VAIHLGLPVNGVRLAFIALTLAGGAGILAYGALWLLVPLSPEAEGLPASSRTRHIDISVLFSIAALLFGVLLLLQLAGFHSAPWWPVIVFGLGAALVWQRADEEQRERLWGEVARRRSGRGAAIAQLVGGVSLVILGSVAVLVSRTGLAAASQLLFAALVVIIGATVLLGPWAVRVIRERDAERSARIRTQERAEVAAQVHDSVLQTLALIQRHARDPRMVARLSRTQERELRQLLYAGSSTIDAAMNGGTFQAALTKAAEEVEDGLGADIELVCVGDTSLDERTTAIVQAAREAMVNAAKYASQRDPVSVFAESDAEHVSVFIRDRGNGFDLNAVPHDRIGVRESIVGRMRRSGGLATIRTSDEGTEVRLEMDRRSDE
jgi:signal transduction histidine kinase